jgi:(p)ppGpp synthase/HD superfamily hydrolase
MYSPRIESAITTMLEAHGLARRKAGRGFEATHVLSVGLIVQAFGFEEDTVIAAILHDTLEDTALGADVIGRRFGSHVLSVVQDVTESPRTRPWRARKEAYIEHLRACPRDAARAVASADKIHNLSSLVAGIETRGPAFIDAFTTGIDEMVWYQQCVYRMLADTWTHPILREHRRRLDGFLAAARGLAR